VCFGEYWVEDQSGRMTNKMPSGVGQIMGVGVDEKASYMDAATAQNVGEKRARIARAARKFAAMYRHGGPGGVGMGTFMHHLYMFSQIRGMEGFYDNTPGDTIWMASPDLDYPEAYLERTMHHELVHLLEENLVGSERKDERAVSWRNRWRAALPPFYEYKSKFAATLVMEFSRGTYEQGFVTPYNQAGMFEDIAQFGALLISGHPEVWRCAEASERCRTKVNLAIELYSYVSPRYDEAFFRSIHQQRGADHHVVEKTEGTFVKSGADFFTNIAVPSWDDYIETLVPVPPPQGSVPNQRPPSFGVAPRPVRLGPDTVNVFIETDPTHEFYGNTGLSQKPGEAVIVPFPKDNQLWVDRIMNTATIWARGYKFGLRGLHRQVGAAYMLKKFGTRGRYFDHPGDTIWVAGRPEFNDKDYTVSTQAFVSVWAHEVTHLIVTRFYKGDFGRDPQGWRRRWTRTLPRGFEYLGPAALGGFEFTPELYESGFLSPYNRKVIYEDIAQFGAALFTGAKETWVCARASAYCRDKVALMIELFSMVHPGYSRQYFLDLAGVDGSGIPVSAPRVEPEPVAPVREAAPQQDEQRDTKRVAPTIDAPTTTTNTAASRGVGEGRAINSIAHREIIAAPEDDTVAEAGSAVQPEMSPEDLALIERVSREAREKWNRENGIANTPAAAPRTMQTGSQAATRAETQMEVKVEEAREEAREQAREQAPEPAKAKSRWGRRRRKD
jgi:hypothetical protein